MTKCYYILIGVIIVVLEVVGAVIIKDNKILAAQRPENKSLGGMWEFPGGKIEEGESPEEALYREIIEEMDCEITVGNFIVRDVYSYDFGDIALSTFYCELNKKEPIANEHSELRWLTVEELDSVVWAPADYATLEILKKRKL